MPSGGEELRHCSAFGVRHAALHSPFFPCFLQSHRSAAILNYSGALGFRDFRRRLPHSVLVAGAGWWAWSRHCEQYDLCYPACRIASNGVEGWKRLPPVTLRSGPVASTASPGSECLSLLDSMRKDHPRKAVAMLQTANGANATASSVRQIAFTCALWP